MKPGVPHFLASAFVAGGVAGAVIVGAWPFGHGGQYRYVVCHWTGSAYAAQVVRDHTFLADVPAPPNPPDFQVSAYTWDDAPCPVKLP